MNVYGTQTGRISSKTPVRSNSPKSADEPAGQELGLQHVVYYGAHLGPRTKATHPYSYDPILVFDRGEEATGSAYSDRLLDWYDRDIVRAKMKLHFGEDGDYYSSRSPAAIQAFLRDLKGVPDLVLTRIEEHCNQATGFPVWYFAYKTQQPS